MAQTRDPLLLEEAYRDAGAYSFDQLMNRFSVTAGTELSPASSPILAHLLHRAVADTNAYTALAKIGHERARPYIEDSRIVPCQTNYLRVNDRQSYPSGHAANGYVAALVISATIPDRSEVLLARGIRYGDNRVVCGVHHPSDVEQGQRIAIAVFEKLRLQKQFLADLDCAAQEYRRSTAGPTPAAPFSSACAVLDAQYRAEFVTKSPSR